MLTTVEGFPEAVPRDSTDLTTSWPSRTFPKIMCLESSHRVFTVVMKNYRTKSQGTRKKFNISTEVEEKSTETLNSIDTTQTVEMNESWIYLRVICIRSSIGHCQQERLVKNVLMNAFFIWKCPSIDRFSPYAIAVSYVPPLNHEVLQNSKGRKGFKKINKCLLYMKFNDLFRRNSDKNQKFTSTSISSPMKLWPLVM